LGNFSSGAGTNNYAVSIFNPANNTKNLFVYSVLVTNGSGGQTAVLTLGTTDTAFTQTNPINSKAGGPASSIQATSRIATTNQAIAGTIRQVLTVASASFEMLPNGDGILLPAGSANSFTAYIQTFAAGVNSAILKWVEY
jgi:hypothetical protein